MIDGFHYLNNMPLVFIKTTQDAGKEQITRKNLVNSELCKSTFITKPKSHVTQYSIVKKYRHLWEIHPTKPF